ncbi:MAG TPA: HAD family hydrolase [Verrucomicrobiae bacterium]
MRFEVLATDYDGTLAHHGSVAPETISALERLRRSGRRAFMVTGREIEDLKNIFSRLDLFDVVVAENGALLYYPANGEIKLLHGPPTEQFIQELRNRKVAPLSVGHVIVATYEPHEATVLDVIKKLGLELEIIFNKGSVMVLPTGVNKATGLKAALRQTSSVREKTVAVGDAENDHAFLTFSGFGVAVSNAVPALKKEADLVTSAPHGLGVIELIDRLIADGLEGAPPAAWRQQGVML